MVLPDDVKSALQTKEQVQLLTELCGAGGQSQTLLSGFQKTKDKTKLKELAAQLVKLDKAYEDGGLKGYITKAKSLLEDSKKGVNPLDGWKPSVPKGEKFELGTDKFDSTEQ
ncbi:MAG: hypothetical protein SGARI_008270, partial [Bacillariaceae sp.]